MMDRACKLKIQFSVQVHYLCIKTTRVAFSERAKIHKIRSILGAKCLHISDERREVHARKQMKKR